MTDLGTHVAGVLWVSLNVGFGCKGPAEMNGTKTAVGIVEGGGCVNRT